VNSQKRQRVVCGITLKFWPPDKVAKTFGISVGQVYLAKHRVTEMIAEEVKRLEMKMS